MKRKEPNPSKRIIYELLSRANKDETENLTMSLEIPKLVMKIFSMSLDSIKKCLYFRILEK